MLVRERDTWNMKCPEPGLIMCEGKKCMAFREWPQGVYGRLKYKDKYYYCGKAGKPEIVLDGEPIPGTYKVAS